MPLAPSDNATPTKDEGSGLLPFDWAALVPLVIHPMRVSIIEALRWVGEPLSANDLCKMFDQKYSLGYISYHVKELAKGRVVRKVGQRKVRGATEKFYAFASRH
jgi:Helix-turn-helix domain